MNIGNLNMNDWKTKDIVTWALDKLGYKLLSSQASLDNDLDIYINFIKYKCRNFKKLNELINHFL